MVACTLVKLVLVLMIWILNGEGAVKTISLAENEEQDQEVEGHSGVLEMDIVLPCRVQDDS